MTGGVATFDILDHVWYDNYEDYLQDTMTVTLTPYVITDSGKQQALEPIHYEIDIPLSPIELSTPDSPYQVVSTALYNIVFYVREGQHRHHQRRGLQRPGQYRGRKGQLQCHRAAHRRKQF